MDLLEELMPEMADVVAAQESALMSVIGTLTDQLQHFAATNERQAQRMAQLESTQLSMRLAIKELQNTPAPAPVVVEVPSTEPAPPDASLVEALAALTTKMDKLQQDVQLQVSEVSEQMQQARLDMQSSRPVDDGSGRALLELKFRELDEKVSAQIGELRSEATDSLAEKTKQTEEVVRNQLDQLEKRFDYLSRVKMEVKELMRRADRQDQSIDDVRIGIEMLAKSLGSDDVDSETSEEEEEAAEGEEMITENDEESAPPRAVRKSATHSIPVLRTDGSQKEMDASADASSSQKQDDGVQTESRGNSQAVLVQPDADEFTQTEEPTVPASRPLRFKATASVSNYVRRSLRKRHQRTDPSIQRSLDSVVAQIPEPKIERLIEENEAVAVSESSPGQPEGERTTEAVAAPAESFDVSPPIVEEEQQQETVDVDEEVSNESTDKEEHEGEVLVEELPHEYRTHLVSQQKAMDDQVDLFRSSSSSGNLLRPNILTSVVRARRQRRTSSRKDPDVELSEQSSLASAHEHPHSITRSMTVPARKSISSTPLSALVSMEPRPPLTKERIRQLWMFLLGKLVRLQRLRQLGGINAEKALFRRQQMSMGQRVKRLEENTARLDESLEYIQQHIQDNSSAINALDESIVELQPVVARVQKMERTQKTQARTIVDVEEKLQEIDVEIQRLRTSARRNSSISSSVSSAVTNAISAQLQDVSSKFASQVTAFEVSEKILMQLTAAEIPALHEKIELSLYTLRQEADQRTSEVSLEFQKGVEQLQASQRVSSGNLLVRITEFCNRIYHTLLGMSGAMLQAVDLGRAEKSARSSTRSSLDVCIELLHGIFAHFIVNCNSLLSQESASEIDFLVESAMDFQQQLDKLKGQAAMSKAAAHSLALDSGSNNDAHGSASSNQLSSFDDHLVFMTTTKLKELEGALITREAQREGNQIPELTLFMQDVVVQVRSILFLLLLHTEAMASRHHVEDLRSAQTVVQSKVEEHGFALGHLDSTIALVKMLNTRLDSFMEISFAYAKEEDVKKSMEELIVANSDMRDLLTTSLDATRSETLERDGLLGEEMNQLIARVSKKLDKDELLWTQEVLERQVQNVANASLDEHDLVDIHRRLRRKVDKNQLKSLLHGQQGRMDSSSNLLRGGPVVHDGADQRGAPLIGAKCISCHGELPPTKAMIQSVVREEVHQEIAKSRAQKMSPSSLPTFNASNHRNLETFKKELLLASLQQKK